MRTLLVSPFPRAFLLISKLLGGVAVSLLQVYVFLAIAYFWEIEPPPIGYLTVLPALLLSGLMLGALALFMSSVIKQLENFAGVMNFVIFPMFFASSALYPLWRIKESSPLLYEICRFNPFTHAVELIRFALYGQLDLASLGIVLAYTCSFWRRRFTPTTRRKGLLAVVEGREPVPEQGCTMPIARRESPVPLRLGLAVVLAMLAMPAAAARDEPGSDWPCVQRKIDTLTSAQMWDGAPIDDVNEWRDDPEVKKVLPTLVSRRVPIGEAATAIRQFAEAIPEASRDAKLKLLFAAILATMNAERSTVMSGIERFQQRQKARAAELERQGLALKTLREKAAAADGEAKAELARAEERYNWDARVFGERQQSIPIACEIPVLFEQRVFELGREIRSHMKD